LHFIAARRNHKLPLPEKIHLSQASQHDLAALHKLAPRMPAKSGLFADKAYFHAETFAEFKESGSFLMASYKRHRNEPEKDVPTLYNRFVSAIRQPLESLFGWIIQ
jgi:IS5 family transposase